MRLPTEIQDRTAHTDPKKRLKVRPLSGVDTIVLHQMSFSRGSVASLYDTVTAHFAVLLDGQILKLHPIESYLAASSDLNDWSVAIEFAGNFPNENGTYWAGDSGRHVPTGLQIASGQDLVRHLNEHYGMYIIYAHRQGEGKVGGVGYDRSNCPGPDIWYEIGEWAKNELGMEDGGKGYKVGRGMPIPDAWRKPRKR
jgi:hypothetical protein